ncbi:phage head-tail connector protein [Halalkalibacter krulwichiae]|uniref:Phage gp6-like head-tail connector protein n=1 Tax=Halalkalibacter krulwichiae TaxID=199441 RepID=A0A1X9MHM0_9BACI|nr:DNA-packaging protein [Halalkalibacter krulwichiae]ARK32134.1 hypothetical protein BkAM31D_21070 [Halalkalibacter krulwichiae]
MLESVKLALRITNKAYDSEVVDLIAGARTDLIQAGVSSVKANSDDPLINRAITTYCKANFGMNNPDAERFMQSYEMLKQHLSLAGDYNGNSLE